MVVATPDHWHRRIILDAIAAGKDVYSEKPLSVTIQEALAVREARRLGLPIVALVDTNCDPDEADYVIPGNDDAIRACTLIAHALAEGINEGRQKVGAREFQQRNGRAQAQAAEPQQPTVPEGDYEQVSAGEEPAAQPPVRDSEPVEGDRGNPEVPPSSDAPAPEAPTEVQP